MRPFASVCGALTIAALAADTPAAAQIVRGTVIGDLDRAPVASAVVRLDDQQGARLIGGITDSLGHFSLRAPAAGRFRLRVERVGYVSFRSPDIDVRSGETVERTLTVSSVRTALTGITVTGKDRCEVNPDEGAAAARVWAAARAALDATLATDDQQMLWVTRTLVDRELTPSRKVISQHSSTASGMSRNPFRSAEPESLAVHGYVRMGKGEVEYFAPDANVLLSDAFADGHCVRLQRTDAAHAGLIGLAFEPAKGRGVADVRGVLWVSEATSELKTFDFSYTQLPGDYSSDAFGGHLDFRALPSGAWIVERWLIRMPKLEKMPSSGTPYITENNVRLSGVWEHGGQVVTVETREGQAVASSALATVRGTVFDSSHGKPLAGAVVRAEGSTTSTTTDSVGAFTLTGLAEGPTAVLVSHPVIDAWQIPPLRVTADARTNASATVDIALPAAEHIVQRLCGGDWEHSYHTVVVGIVRDAQSGAELARDTVRATWRDASGGATSPSAAFRSGSSITDSLGRYRLCGVPPGTPILIQAARSPNPTGAAVVELSGELAAQRDLAIARGATATSGGTAQAIVRAVGADQRPIGSASVSVVRLPATAVTDASGVAHLSQLPEGTVIVVVRRPGVGERLTTAELSAGQSTTVTAVLGATSQVAVATPAPSSTARSNEFERRRHGGVGYFMTQEDIERRAAPDLHSLLVAVPGLSAVTAPSGGYEVVSLGGRGAQRTTASQTGSNQNCTSLGDATRAASASMTASAECPTQKCPVTYYVDGGKVHAEPAHVDDVIKPGDIAAIEAYSSGADVPARYSDGDSGCGAVLIWSKRFMKAGQE